MSGKRTLRSIVIKKIIQAAAELSSKYVNLDCKVVSVPDPYIDSEKQMATNDC